MGLLASVSCAIDSPVWITRDPITDEATWPLAQGGSEIQAYASYIYPHPLQSIFSRKPPGIILDGSSGSTGDSADGTLPAESILPSHGGKWYCDAVGVFLSNEK